MLDIDGVLNSHKSQEHPSSASGMVIDRHAIQYLNTVLEYDPEISIVISSSWIKKLSLLEFSEILEKEYHLIPGRIVDVLSSGMKKDKAIRKWVEDNKPTALCVLDDEWIFDLNDPIQSHFVKLSAHEGLQDKHLDVIVSLLS